jgi:integrase
VVAGLLDSRIHDMRDARPHSYWRRGWASTASRTQLGHSSVALTSYTYAHVLEQRPQREVARVLDAVLGD